MRNSKQQRDLDNLAFRMRWHRGKFRSWRTGGYLISVTTFASGEKGYVVVRGSTRREVLDLDKVLELVVRTDRRMDAPAANEPD